MFSQIFSCMLWVSAHLISFYLILLFLLESGLPLSSLYSLKLNRLAVFYLIENLSGKNKALICFRIIGQIIQERKK